MIKGKPIPAIRCNFQTCFSCQKVVGGVEIRPHTVHSGRSISAVSYIRGFFNSTWNTYRLCLKRGSWESFSVLAVNAHLVIALIAGPGKQHPVLHSGSCWKKIRAMEVERPIVHFETWRRDCGSHCRSRLPHSSKTALQPRPRGWCRLTVDDWGVSFISIMWFMLLCVMRWERGWAMARSALWGQLPIEPRSCKWKSTALLLSPFSAYLVLWFRWPRRQNLEDSSKNQGGHWSPWPFCCMVMSCKEIKFNSPAQAASCNLWHTVWGSIILTRLITLAH